MYKNNLNENNLNEMSLDKNNLDKNNLDKNNFREMSLDEISLDEILDDVKYENDNLFIIGTNGLTKTSINLNLLQRQMERFYDSIKKNDSKILIGLKYRHMNYFYYISATEDVVQIYYNHTICRVDRKKIEIELDKHFKKEKKYCIICTIC